LAASTDVLELLEPVLALVLPTVDPLLVLPWVWLAVAPPSVLAPVLSEFAPLLDVLAPVLDVLGPLVAPPSVFPPVLSVLPPLLDVLAPVVAPPRVLPPLLDVLAPGAAEEVLSDVVLLPVDVPPAAVLLVLPPDIVPLVFPPAIVPVVVFVEFWLVWLLFAGLMVTPEAFEADEVPLKLLLLVVPVADEGLDVSPTV
jgi:hypothetical protein